MGVFGKSFFNFPPADPEDPGFAQDNNRSLTEAHSTGKEIADLLSHYDEETITSLDGAKYQVMAQREGSGVASDAWWSPSINLEEMTLKIAPGAITAPYSAATAGTDGSITHPQAHYAFFDFPEQNGQVEVGNNYFFIIAEFTERKFTGQVEIPTAPTFMLQYDVYYYNVTGVGDFDILREMISPPLRLDEDGVLDKGQLLGWYNITEEDGKKKVADHKWRTGHVIDFRPVQSITMMGGTGVAPAPSSPN